MIPRIKLFLIVILVIIGFSLSRYSFDYNLFTLSSIENDQLLKRDGGVTAEIVSQVSGREIMKYYINRYMVYSLKLFRKISYPLNLTVYFNFNQNNFYPYVLLPMFIVGCLYTIRYHLAYLLLYIFISAIFTCTVISSMTIILYYPLISTLVVIGLYLSIRYVHKLRR
jgi:hypothetical protein